MSRPQGSKNKEKSIATPDTVLFSTEERVAFLAGLIADRIAEDEAAGFPLLKEIKGLDNEPRPQTA